MQPANTPAALRGAAIQPFSKALIAGAGLAVALVIVNLSLCYRNTRQLREDVAWVTHTHEVVASLENLLALATDAETGQRGFIITGEPAYLEPYNDANASVNKQIRDIVRLIKDNPQQQARFDQVREHVSARLRMLDENIKLRREAGLESARQSIMTGRGKREMDSIRGEIASMIDAEHVLLRDRTATSNHTYRLAIWSGLATGVAALAALVAFLLLLRRHLVARGKTAFIIAEQAERLRTTLASIGDAVITTDMDGRVTNMNAVAESLTGWTNADALGQPLEQVFHIVNEDTRQPVANPATRALKEGVIVGLANHTVLIAKGGSEQPIDDSAAPIRCAEGEIVGCVLVFRDVTERRRAELEIREARSRLESTLVAGEIGTWEFDVVENVVRADGNLARMIGMPPEAATGPLETFLGLVHSDDREWVTRQVAQTIQSDARFDIECRLQTPDGATRWIAARARVQRDESGRALRMPGVVMDVTQRRFAEEDRRKFVTLVETITDFVGMCDLQGKPFYVNAAGMRMVGLEDLDEVRRTPVREFFFPEDQTRIMEEFLPAVLEKGEGEVEVRFRHFRTGQALWMLYKVVALLDAQGQRVGLATVSRDITQRRQLEDNLRQLASDLSESSRRKDEFLATLAHELRNPLAPIRNGLQLMKVAPDAESAEQARALMERQFVQLVRLVDDLLDVNRITRGKIDLRLDRVELASIIEQAVETSRPAIEAGRHELTVTLPPEPIYLDGDRVRLVQVFGNLLNNSCKYSEPGGSISVGAQKDQGEVSVTVRDTGIGIPADMLPRVFEMFTQIDQSLDRAEGGLGIGLTLVKRLVELHNGSVHARSEGAGRGSEFEVRLPIVAQQPPPQPAAADGQPRPAAGRRILVVDDNQDSALSLAMLLKMTGHETRTAFDGLAAVEAAEAFRPEVVLLDIGLPKLNGYEAARRIRQQPWGESMVLVALTGWGQAEDRERSADAGFNAHMVKPVEHAALAKLLSELLPT